MYDEIPEAESATLSIGYCSDEHLVAQCRRESSPATDAFSVLMKRYRQPVYLACLHYLQSEAEAQEACQEVFFRVFCISIHLLSAAVFAAGYLKSYKINVIDKRTNSPGGFHREA